MPKLRIYTIGYQGLNLSEYVEELKRHDIKVLLDVREVAWSRKKGFSKSALASELEANGIKYYHVRSAGNPRSIRRTALSPEDCLNTYRGYLSTNPAGTHDVMEHLRNYTKRSMNLCITCFEHEPEDCHRSIITEALLDIEPNLSVVHIHPMLPEKRSKASLALAA